MRIINFSLLYMYFNLVNKLDFNYLLVNVKVYYLI